MKREIGPYGIAFAAYAAILLASAAVEDVLMRGLWRPFDIASYYGLAASASSSIYALADAASSTPMFLLGLGVLSGYRIYVVSILCLAAAMLAMDAGNRIYGGVAGFLAGLLFALNVAGAQGYITAGEGLAFVLVLLSAHALLFRGSRLVSGLCAGAAACLAPLALFIAPAAAWSIYKKGGPDKALAFAAAALLPLALAAIFAFTIYGVNAPAMAADGGFTVAGLVVAEGYRSPDALMAVANAVLAICLLASMLPLALLGFSREHGVTGDYLLVAGLCFTATILLRQYFHYWYFALPFLALLCAGAFRRPSHGQ